MFDAVIKSSTQIFFVGYLNYVSDGVYTQTLPRSGYVLSGVAGRNVFELNLSTTTRT